MAGKLPQPEEAEDERDASPDRDDPPADHEPDEETRDADGDADRPHAQTGEVRLVLALLGIHPRHASRSLFRADSTGATPDCQRRNT